MTKTRDGLRIPRLITLLQSWGIEIREGTNHPYIANYKEMRPCPIAKSTDAKTMLNPWLCQALDKNRKELYQTLKHYC